MKAGLKAVEHRFQEFVLNGSPGIEASVALDTIAPTAQRLDVYFQAYRLRLLEALGNDYPGLKRFIGEAEFERLARAYVDRRPSTERSLRWFGKSFAQFLDESPEGRACHPVLAGIAAFEWARGEVFDAADAPVVTVEEIGALAPEQWPALRLTLHPALRRLRLAWNAPAICKAVVADTVAPPPQPAPAEWLLWRRDLEVHWRSLDAPEARALDSVAGGASFARICEELLDRQAPEGVALQAAGLLKRWVIDGLVTRYSAEGLET